MQTPNQVYLLKISKHIDIYTWIYFLSYSKKKWLGHQILY